MVFRNVLPAPFTPEADRGCVGEEGAGSGDGGGWRLEDGARRPLFGVVRLDFVAGVARFPVLFLVFPTGSAGRAMVGGPFVGLDGLGSAVDMAAW